MTQVRHIKGVEK